MSDSRMRHALLPGRLFDGEHWLHEHAVIITGDTITAVVPAAGLDRDMPCRELAEGILAPGFIDLQVNGGGGVLFNNAPTAETLHQMVAGHRARGTTGMMPTLISDTPEVHRAGVAAVRAAREQGNTAILGIHIEGPFFALNRRGTHQAAMIRPPAAADIDWLCALGELPVMLTLAPEHSDNAAIARLTQAGVMVCAGHTDASYEQIESALAAGLRGFTHLFNAMSPLTGRAPGTVGAALASAQSWVGIIADGHHVHPACIRIAQRALAAGKLCLVTDAMATVGSEQSSFELYGERITEAHGRLVNAEGALAGSAIGMIDAVRYCTEIVGLPLAECLRMAATYPAHFLGRERQLGRIAPGYRADLLCFDDQFQVLDTWLAGQAQISA